MPSVLARLQAAMLRAAVASLLLSVLVVFVVLLIGTVDVAAGSAEQLPDVRTLIPSAGLLAVGLFVVLTPTLLLLSTRPMQDRAFTAAGFLATFFGLTMLMAFFLQLGHDALDWFAQTPRLIEQQNSRLVAAVESAKTELATVMAERDKALDKVGADPAKRAQLQELFDLEVADKQATLAEQERNQVRDQRTDTSAATILWHFLTSGPAALNRPQDAGIWFALLGSLWMGLITVLFAVPIGVGAAIYLEEYRSNSWLSRLIQLNINNLAGVPSVVYGILGAFVFVGLVFQPLHRANSAIAARNVLGGGLTLGLLTLPIVIVAAQEAIRAVPSSVRHGAIALGATRWQTTWRTVLPMSFPGILTGTILALSRAIGEAAPLLLFGAIMFIDEQPSLFSRFTVLPMQIFGWARRPPTALGGGESIEAWRNNAAMASVVLLVTLLAMNALAIYLRNRAHKQSRY